MNSVDAFVGHSFSREDSEVVDKFLKYFEAISEINPAFSWVHAESAEPTLIDSKVLRLFGDKNLFIGICTRKERVVAEAALTKSWWKSKILSGKESAFAWKTSDWIIQEIGLAIGREMHVMLLVESGVRSPGGLQGNLEYIEFDRDAPERAFGKVLEMVATLSTEDVLGDGAAVETSPSVEEKHSQKREVETSWLTPNDTWQRKNFEMAYMHYVAIEDQTGADRISSQYLSSSADGAAVANTESWLAFTEYMRIYFGTNGSLKKLESIVQQNNGNVDVLEYLARSYRVFEEIEKAADVFERAASLDSLATRKISLIGEAIESIATSNPDRAKTLLDQARNYSSGDDASKRALLSIERSFSASRKEDDFRFAAMERMLEMEPDDHETRFALAYAYSEKGHDDLAILHYTRIPYAERNGLSWNNLGVARERRKMPVKSVQAYEMAKAKGETLAMSNLAIRLLEAGFIGQAQGLCEEGIAIPDHHKNLDTTLARVKDAYDEEDKKEKDLLNAASTVVEIYRNAGLALVDRPVDISGAWGESGRVVNFVVDGDSFSGLEFLEEARSVLRVLGGEASKPDKFEVSYKGKIRGRAMLGTFEKRRKDSAALSSLFSEERREILMYVSSDGASLTVMSAEAENRIHMHLKKIDVQKELGRQKDTQALLG